MAQGYGSAHPGPLCVARGARPALPGRPAPWAKYWLFAICPGAGIVIFQRLADLRGFVLRCQAVERQAVERQAVERQAVERGPVSVAR